MEEEKVKVVLLGLDRKLISSICKKVNSTRPAEVQFFSELKDFLVTCIGESPDLIGVSLNFPHKSISRFPEVFKMAFSVPVLTFGENQELKTTKLLAITPAEFKISGAITAHNLWMKIINFRKKQSDELEKIKNSKETSGSEIKTRTSIFLKGSVDRTNIKNKNTILTSLFAALENSDKDGSESRTQMSQSSEAARDKKENPNFVNSLGKEKKPVITTGELKENKSDKAVDLEKTKMNSIVMDSSELLNNQMESEATVEEESSVHPEPKKEDAIKSKETKFGKVQLSDEKEMKKKEQQKSKEQLEKEGLKIKNLLLSSCELALEKVFNSAREDAPKEMNTSQVNVLIVEVGSYKGFLLLANSGKKPLSAEQIKSFRKAVIEDLKENGASGEISSDFSVIAEVERYTEVVKAFSEFSVNFVNEAGEQQVVSFVKREVVRPTLSESDKEDMYLIDIKVIPPQTPVNFDAFLFLPRNNRFVRYLKNGRSLSLKQAKRHTEEEDGQSKLYLPKKNKEEFLQFYIQNTLNWEFALHKKHKKDVA